MHSFCLVLTCKIVIIGLPSRHMFYTFNYLEIIVCASFPLTRRTFQLHKELIMGQLPQQSFILYADYHSNKAVQRTEILVVNFGTFSSIQWNWDMFWYSVVPYWDKIGYRTFRDLFTTTKKAHILETSIKERMVPTLFNFLQKKYSLCPVTLLPCGIFQHFTET